MSRCFLPITIVACVSSTVSAQPRVDALVISVSGRSVYLNAGRQAGIAPGARVVFFLSSGERIEATIVDVTSNSSRAEVHERSPLPGINDRAEVDTDSGTPPTETGPLPPPTTQPVPEHPPWTRQEGERGQDTPLLAPAFGTPPQDRPLTVRGRIYSLMRLTKDLENDYTYTYLRAGTWLDIRNPFHDGGRILFDGDADYRNADTFGGGNSDQDLRIKRFSYAWGLDQHARYRAEVGRFYSYALPEIGLVDGGELAVRFENGWSLGGGAGLYPTTSEDLIKGDDLGFHLFADYQAEAPDRWFQGTIGFQQTWHEGETDRSLLIGRVNARPTRDLSLFGSILIDLYGSEDTIKSQAAEITQFVAQASYQFNPRTGVNGSVMRSSWPELKRNEYVSFPPELLTDGFVDRVSATLWRRVSDQLRVSARSHAWRDQDMNGFGGEVSADWYVRGPGNPSYYGSLYYEDSAFTRGVGARLQARRDIGQVRVFAGYDLFASTADSQFGDDADLVRHTLRASASWSRGRWTWDLETEYTFGDAEQSIGLNAYAQYRF